MPIWEKFRRAFNKQDSAPGTAPPIDAAADRPVGPEEFFLAQVEAAFRADPHVTNVKQKAGEFALLVTREGIESTTYLGNIFSDWRDAAPEARAAGIQRFVRSLHAPNMQEVEWEDARQRLVPVLRGASMFAGLPNQAVPLQRPFAPFLLHAIAIDGDDSIRYATESDLTDWGIVLVIAFSTSTDNASRYFEDADIETYDPQAPYPIWHVAKDDDYQASRLLVPNWLAHFEGNVRGRPIAIAPHRSLLIVGGDGDTNCLQRLLTAARSEFKASARRISPMLYTVDDKQAVVPYQLPAGHLLANELALSGVVLADYEYGQQKLSLEKIFGDKAFVATFTAFKNPEGKVTSRAVWSKGVPTLLPKAELIALNASREGGSDTFAVRWEDLVRIAGSSLEPVPGLNPERWGTGAWPDPKMLSELRVLAIL